MKEQTQFEPPETAFLDVALDEKNINDARSLLENPGIQMLVACGLIVKQVSHWVAHNLEQAIQGREIEDPKLTIQALRQSVQMMSHADSLSPFELRQAVLDTLLPVLGINCQMQAGAWNFVRNAGLGERKLDRLS